MANLSKDQVRDIIAKAPKGVSGEDIVNQLVASGHSLEGFSAPAQAAPEKTGIWNYLTTKDLDNAPALDVAAQAARLGQFANRGNQDLAGIIAERGGQKASGEQGMQIPVPKALAGGRWWELGKSGQNIDAGAIPDVAAAGTLATGSEFLIPQNRLGVYSYMLGPAVEKAQELKQSIFPTQGFQKPGWMAQLLSAKSKSSPQDIQLAIDRPETFASGSVADANLAYGKSAGPLQGAARTIEQRSNSWVPGETEWKGLLDETKSLLEGTAKDAAGNPRALDSQGALEGVQTINRYLRNYQNTKKLDKVAMSNLLGAKEELMQFLENNGSPGMREAATNLRMAHVNENLGNLVPQNKSGGTDALRGMMMAGELATAGSHAAVGNIAGAVPYALDAVTASPRFVGGLIRNYHSITNPAVIGAAGQAINAAQNIPPTYRVQSTLADAYARQPR